jgi:hypothetical protein
MENTVEERIYAHLGTLLDALKTGGKVREVARLSDLLVQAAVTPQIGYNLGPETAVSEDNFGYTLECNLVTRLWLNDYRSEAMLKLALDLKGEAIALLEADEQFGGLINWIKYVGDEKYIDTKIAKPAGGLYLIHRIQYRRRKARTDQNY